MIELINFPHPDPGKRSQMGKILTESCTWLTLLRHIATKFSTETRQIFTRPNLYFPNSRHMSWEKEPARSQTFG